jgi:CD36 family
VSPPVPVYMKLKFLTVENPDDVSNGSKPQLKELGPFVYRETRRKENIEVTMSLNLFQSARCSAK